MRNRRRNGFSLLELLIVVAIIMIIMLMAAPNLLKSKASVNEASAVNTLKKIHEASVQYFAQCGGYAPSLTSLGPPANGCATADFLGADVASGRKHEYVFTYAGVDQDGDGKVESFSVKADPIQRGVTGNRSFFIDSSGRVRANPVGPADENSPLLN